MLKQLKDGGRPAADYVGTYLTEDHRDHFIWGCPAAPLASEIMRLGETVQAAFSQGFEGNVAGIADLIGTGDRSRDRQQALFMLSAMVGAMALARATKKTAPDLSGEILRAVSQCLSGEPVR